MLGGIDPVPGALLTAETYKGICSGMQALSTTPLVPLAEYIENVGRWTWEQTGQHSITRGIAKKLNHPLLPQPENYVGKFVEFKAQVLVEGLIACGLAQREYDSLGRQITDIAQRWLKPVGKEAVSLIPTSLKLQRLSSLAFRLGRGRRRSQDTRAIFKAIRHLEKLQDTESLYPQLSQMVFVP
jgi:hypothetical protein